MGANHPKEIDLPLPHWPMPDLTEYITQLWKSATILEGIW